MVDGSVGVLHKLHTDTGLIMGYAEELDALEKEWIHWNQPKKTISTDSFVVIIRSVRKCVCVCVWRVGSGTLFGEVW